MSSVIDSGKCPRCGTEDAYITDFDCKTGEEDSFCMACGHTYSFGFKRDDDYELVRTPVEYQSSDCVFGVKDKESGELIYAKPVSEIENLSEQIFTDWLNTFSWNKTDKSIPDGYYNIFYIGNETPEQLFYLGNYITVGETPETIVVHKVEIEEITNDGYGVMNIFWKDGHSTTYFVEESSTEEELIAEANRIVTDNTEIEFLSVTMFNEEKQRLEKIYTYGEIPTLELFDFEDEELEEAVF